MQEETLNMRLTKEEKERLKMLAEEEGLNMTQFLRYRLLKETPTWQDDIKAIKTAIEEMRSVTCQQ